SRKPRAPRRADDHGHARVAGEVLAQACGSCGGPGKNVDVVSDDARAAISDHETSIVNTFFQLEPIELWNVDSGSHRQHVGVRRDGPNRRDGFSRSAPTPWKGLPIELLKADFLIGPGAELSASAIAFGEAHSTGVLESSASLHAYRIMERSRDASDRGTPGRH